MAEWVTMTRAMVDEGMSLNGGFSLRQLRCLGTTWKDNPGWLGRLVGSRVLRVDYERFLALKNQHVRGDRRRKTKKGRGVFSEAEAADYRNAMQHMRSI